MIFAQTAPLYWGSGLPVIPLWANQKNPIPNAWQTYAEKPVEKDQQDLWLRQYAGANLGLPLGPESAICVIDIDTDDQAVLGVLSKILPPSPWERRGQKGIMLAYAWSDFKTFRIKDAGGRMLVEGLNAGTQCVLPPSIHPDTRQPYVANCELWEPSVLARLVHLPPGIEGIIRGALESAGIDLSISGHTKVTDWVAPGARDVQMISVAGMMSHAILKGERTFKEAMEMLISWHAMRVEKVAGDDIDIAKGVGRIAQYLISDVTGHKALSLPEGWDDGLEPGLRMQLGLDIFKDEHIAWDKDRLMQWLMAEYAVHDAGTLGRRRAVDYVLDRMARSKLGGMDQGIFLTWIAKTSGFGVTKAQLERELKDREVGDLKGTDHTQIAQYVLRELNEKGEVAFVGSFWQWRGSNWELLPNSEVMKLIAESYGHLPGAKKAGDHVGILKTMQNLCAGELKKSSVEGVNFANGFLTPELNLLPHSSDFGCTYTLPYRYVEELADHAVRFEEFLASCWGDDEDYADKRLALQEALAATFFSMAPRFERVFCLQGAPGSGKSQVLKIIKFLLPPEVVSAVGPEDWGDKFLPAMLYGKILNICGELSEEKRIDGMRFKQIVSGEVITGQHKNGQPFAFSPRCAHWFASNHIPKTRDTSQGFNRRWLLLVYDKIVGLKDRVLDLGTLIAAEEREAIAAWAVQGIGRLLEQKTFTEPASHAERVQEMAKSNNSLRSFLLDSGKVLVARSVATSQTPILEMDLYNAYFTFAIAAQVARPVSLDGFRQKMRELGSEMGFRLRVTDTPNGGQDCVYESLILVRGNVVPMKRQPGTS